MRDCLLKLKTRGFNPTHILDIGALFGHWSRLASEIFPDSEITMVEPIKHQEHTEFSNPEFFSHNNWSIRHCILNEKVAEVEWYEGPTWSGDSMYCERTRGYKNCESTKKATTTLDIEFENYFTSGPELIKIDTQGAELPILKGGQTIVSKTEVIILEVPFFGVYNEGSASFAEYISYMDSIGYVPFDIAEQHLLDNISIQLDIAFVKKDYRICSDFQNVIDNWSE